MSKRNTKNAKHPAVLRREFLNTGGQTYLPAAAAVSRFQHEVFKLCSKVVAKRCDELSSASGIKLDKHRISVHPTEWKMKDLFDWAGDADNFGARLPLGKIAVLHCYISWEYDHANKPKATAIVSVAFNRRTDSRRMLEELRAVGDTDVKDEDYGELCLSEPIDAARFAEVDRLLDRLLTQWIRLLKKKGGLKASLE